jgi:hypothetical protein
LTVVNIVLQLVEPNPQQQWAADSSGDGQINILDALGIVNVILDIGECVP